ncbi:MAG TPA: sigma-54 dependent transcriptional regulator [Arachidicoccus sp.]|nr:sigma-54 dependent transcriptional regulator [Arachidicoccus sp.]
MKKILIIDDDISICKILSNFLQKSNYETSTALSGKQAFQILKKDRFDLILCDYNLGDIKGVEILSKINEKFPGTIVIFISGYGNIQTAVDLVKDGAYHFLTKPLYPDIILSTIEKAFAQKKPKTEKPQIKAVVETDNYVKGISGAAKKLFEHVALVAPTDYSVLIHGETGTGKEALARLIHDQSSRSKENFVAIDCGSLSKELAASELFGHLKGAFTGAMHDKKGAFEIADGGTIFLDEIGNLSYEVQMYLLRTLQEKSVRCIGEVKERVVDVRVIAASNEDLHDKTRNKLFREDLYHRLNEFKLEVPALYQRCEDIPLLANAFISQANNQLNKKIAGLSPEVKKLFSQYKWPGNIRELQNVIKRACLFTDDGELIDIENLPLEITDYTEQRSVEGPAQLKNVIMEAQKSEIMRVLERVNYNKTKAAAILKIDRKTLYNKLKEIND